MFKDNTIRKGVMKAIDAKIAEKQKEYDTEIIQIDETLEVKIEELRDTAETEKSNLAQKFINDILSKIL